MLHLRDAKVTDAGAEEIMRLTSLQNLWLDNTNVTDAGLKGIAGLKDLRVLILDKLQCKRPTRG